MSDTTSTSSGPVPGETHSGDQDNPAANPFTRRSPEVVDQSKISLDILDLSTIPRIEDIPAAEPFIVHDRAPEVDAKGQIRVLSRDEERALIAKALTGDKNARNKIVEHNLRLVAYVAKSYARDQEMFNELYAEGYHVLFHAIDRFDLSMETKFSTYGTWWIRQAMSKYLHMKHGNGSVYDIDMESPVNKENYENNEVTRLIRDCLYLLTDRESDIIKRRFGIDCSEETLDEIGKDYGLSKERIRQIQEKALEKLKPILQTSFMA